MDADKFFKDCVNEVIQSKDKTLLETISEIIQGGGDVQLEHEIECIIGPGLRELQDGLQRLRILLSDSSIDPRTIIKDALALLGE